MSRRSILILALLTLPLLAAIGCTEVKQTSESEIVPYETVKHDDPSLFEGEKKVVQTGEQGLRTVAFEETYKWGKKIKRRRIKNETVYKPSVEIVNIGTRKAIILTVKTAAGDFEINITAAGRPASFAAGRGKISDALVVKGFIKNIGTKPARTGTPTDLAVISPALRDGLLTLTTSPVAALGPQQSAQTVWAGSLNNGKPGTNKAVTALGQLNVTARSLVGPRNAVMGEVRSLAGLPPI